MKANQLIKDFGLEKANTILTNKPEHATHHLFFTPRNESLYFDEKMHLQWCELEGRWASGRFHMRVDCMTCLSELERLVRSCELVISKGGVKSAKKEADALFANDIEGRAFEIYDAITDFESCQ